MAAREEIKIALGIDAKAVEMGLTSASGYIDKWINQRKSKESEYSNWWDKELKQRETAEKDSLKRQEQEHAESLRRQEAAEIEGASRRNRARSLRRARAARDQTGGFTGASVPENMGGGGTVSAAIGAGGTAGSFAGAAFLKSMGRTIANMAKGFLVGGVLTAVGLAWDSMTGKMAEMMFGGDLFTKSTARHKEQADVYRQERKDREAEAKAAAETAKTTADRLEEEGDIRHQIQQTEKETAALKEKPLDAEAQSQEKIKRNLADIAALRAKIKVVIGGSQDEVTKQGVENQKTILDIKKKELENAKEEKEMAERRQKTEEEIAKEKRDAAADQKQKQFDAAQAEKAAMSGFQPSVGELADSGRWVKGNWTGKWRWQPGRFANQAGNIERFKDMAKEQFIGGDVEGAKRSIGNYNRLYDDLAKAGIITERPEVVAKATLAMAEDIKGIRKDGIPPHNGP